MDQNVTRVLVTRGEDSWQANSANLPGGDAIDFARLVRNADFSNVMTDLFDVPSTSSGGYWIVAQTDKEVLCNGWSTYDDLSPSAKQVVDMTIAYHEEYPSLVDYLMDLLLEMTGDLAQDPGLRFSVERHLARFMAVWGRYHEGHLDELQKAQDDLRSALALERKAAYQRWAERATK